MYGQLIWALCSQAFMTASFYFRFFQDCPRTESQSVNFTPFPDLASTTIMLPWCQGIVILPCKCFKIKCEFYTPNKDLKN